MKLKLIRNPEEVKKEIDLSTLERFIRNHTGHKSECIKKIYDDINHVMKWPGFENQIDEWLHSFNVKGIEPEYLIGILTIINSDLMWESSETGHQIFTAKTYGRIHQRLFVNFNNDCNVFII